MFFLFLLLFLFLILQGVNIEKLIAVGNFISKELGKPTMSRVARALSSKLWRMYVSHVDNFVKGTIHQTLNHNYIMCCLSFILTGWMSWPYFEADTLAAMIKLVKHHDSTSRMGLTWYDTGFFMFVNHEYNTCTDWLLYSVNAPEFWWWVQFEMKLPWASPHYIL